MERRWLNPLADLVFKRIFGQEKEILIELINGIIQLKIMGPNKTVIISGSLFNPLKT
jgi:hypothetical protein